jgi:hypothetical protein
MSSARLLRIVTRRDVTLALILLACLIGQIAASATWVRPNVVTVETPMVVESGRRGAGGRAAPATMTTGSDGSVCTGAAPDSSYTCQNGVWAPPAGSSSGRAGGCSTAKPGDSFVCQNGLWVLAGTARADSPSGAAASDAAIGGSNPPSPTLPCVGPRPTSAIAGMTAACVDGVWVIR